MSPLLCPCMKRGNSTEAKHVQVTRVLQEPQALSTLSKSTGVPESLCMLPLAGHGQEAAAASSGATAGNQGQITKLLTPQVLSVHLTACKRSMHKPSTC